MAMGPVRRVGIGQESVPVLLVQQVLDRLRVLGQGVGHLGPEGGAEEVEQQRHEQAPGQQAAAEVQGRQLRADDVADADVSRRHAGGRDERAAAGLGAAGGVDAQQLVLEGDERLAFGGEQLELLEELDGGADAHGGEQELGPAALGAAAGLVDLGGGHRFGERQLLVLHHDPPQDGHEQNADETTHQHDGGGLEVVGQGHEIPRPDSGDHERRNREDGPGGDRFADGADGPGDVLLENAALEQLQQGHADDGGRVGRGDGHAGLEAEVGVGGAEDHRQRQTDGHGPKGELLHVRRHRNVGDVLLIGHTLLLGGVDETG